MPNLFRAANNNMSKGALTSRLVNLGLSCPFALLPLCQGLFRSRHTDFQLGHHKLHTSHVDFSKNMACVSDMEEQLSWREIQMG